MTLPGTRRTTLDFDDGPRPRARAGEPVLIVALECQRPESLSSMHGLGNVDAVTIGRRPARGAVRSNSQAGRRLEIGVPDGWMSAAHARILRVAGRFVLEDAGARNGCLVNGAYVQRRTLRDGDLLELGRTLFLFRESLALAADDCDVAGTSAARVGLVTFSPELAAQLVRVAQLAPAGTPLLIVGDTGTGKDVLARAIHELSGRCGPYVAVNCGAIAANLVESELFGHVRGAFSGAERDHLGLVRSADGGTLFLDEVGDLPLAAQAALLRVLQDGEVRPVGAASSLRVQTGVVSATQEDVDDRVARGALRRDLYARLAAFRVNLPPLRRRREDLGILAGSIVARHGAVHGIHPDAARALFTYDWPLNVRELENALATALVLAGEGPIDLQHLPPALRVVEPVTRRSRAPTATAPPPLDEAQTRRRDGLLALLREHAGNVSAVARASGKNRKQIQRWLKRYALDPDAYRRDA
jgi:sigma-54 dependent transcriptional regulator, acetoin dehydrogenase operon transcriptional activator AcoR